MAPCVAGQQRRHVGACALIVLAASLAVLEWSSSGELAFDGGKGGSRKRPMETGKKVERKRWKEGETFMSWSASQTGIIGGTPAGWEYKRKKAATEEQVILTARFRLNATKQNQVQHRNEAKYGDMHAPPPVTYPFETSAERCSHSLNGKEFMGHQMRIMVDKSRKRCDKAHFLGLPSYELSDPDTMIRFRRWLFNEIGHIRWVTDNSGTVRFDTNEELEKAIEMMDGGLVEGRKISVAPHYDDPETLLQVRGLHPDTRGDVLFDMFSQAGEVIEATGPGDEEPETLPKSWWQER